jgi:Flp pilus assembly pilin Flp
MRDVLAFHRDERGLETIEWMLLLGVVIVPAIAFMLKLSVAIGEYYSHVSWVISLPFL